VRILGIVGSRRKMGNTEILVKETLLGARDEGADVALVGLTDLCLEECNGCMACVMRDARCGLKDDFYFLMEQMEGAEGMVLGAPTYIYAPAGIIKVLLDRFAEALKEAAMIEQRPRQEGRNMVMILTPKH